MHSIANLAAPGQEINPKKHIDKRYTSAIIYIDNYIRVIAMGKVLNALTGMRDESREMMLCCVHGSDLYTRFYLQVWGLEHMIKIVNRAIRAKNKLASHVKARGK